MLRREKSRRLSFEALENRRVLASGDLDPTFGNGGKVIDSAGDLALDVAFQSDGKIVVAGQSITAGDSDVVILRYDESGSPDASFGQGGRVAADFDDAQGSSAAAVAVQANGKIVVVGQAFDGLGVARFNANGTPDTTFSVDGRLVIAGAPHSARDVIVQPNGKIVVAVQPGAVYRFNANGTLDTSFAGDGIAELPVADPQFSTQPQSAEGVTLQDDGKIVVAGTGRSGNLAAVWRLNADGTADTSFERDGATTIQSFRTTSANNVILQPDGRIVVVGRHGDDMLVARLLVDGSHDRDFAGRGFQAVNFPTFNRDEAFSAAFQDDGKIVVAGFANSTSSFGVVRLRSNGAPDGSFSVDGQIALEFQGEESARGVAARDGKIIVAGYTRNAQGVPSVALGRLDADSRPNTVLLSDTTVAENLPAGTVIGTLSATDDDPGDTFTYAFVTGTGSTNNGGFEIVGNELRTRYPHDFERKNSFAIRVAATDTQGNTREGAFTIRVENADDLSPVLGGIPSGVGYQQNGPAVRLAPGATLSDPDTASFAGARLVVAITGGADASNRIVVGGSFTLVGTEVRRGGVAYATINPGGGVGTTPLELTFTANITQSIAQQLLRAIYFRTFESTSTATRILAFTLFDSSGNESNKPTELVVVE